MAPTEGLSKLHKGHNSSLFMHAQQTGHCGRARILTLVRKRPCKTASRALATCNQVLSCQKKLNGCNKSTSPLTRLCAVCRYAHKGTSKDSTSKDIADQSLSSQENWEDTDTSYSQATLKSLALVDEEVLNYDLLEALVVHIAEVEAANGCGAFLKVSTPMTSFD